MTFKNFWISLIVIIFAFPSLCFSAQPDSKVWESFDKEWYYNKTNISKSSYIISVWIYKTVTNDNRKEKVEILKKTDLDKSVKYQKFDHYLSLWEIDTKNKQRRLKELTDYDDKGNVLESNAYKDREWKDIKPNSVFDKLYVKISAQKETLAKELPAKEKSAKEQLAKEQLAKEQLAKEQLAKEQLAKEQQAKEQEAKEQQAKEQQAKEQLAKEQQAKEQQTKEQQTKEQREQQARELDARDIAAGESQAKEPPVREPSATIGKPLSKAWESISDNVFYNKKNITKSSKIITVWTYNIVTDDFREQKIEAIKKNDLEKSKKYAYYDHNVVLSDINCKKRLARTKMYVDYDDNGEELYSYTYTNRDWKNITSGSLGEKLYQKLCMTGKKSLNKKKALSKKKSSHKKKSKIHSSIQKVQDEGDDNQSE